MYQTAPCYKCGAVAFKEIFRLFRRLPGLPQARLLDIELGKYISVHSQW
jgi:predicted nucleic-acid-binding Zn-ribbon protein